MDGVVEAVGGADRLAPSAVSRLARFRGPIASDRRGCGGGFGVVRGGGRFVAKLGRPRGRLLLGRTSFAGLRWASRLPTA